nr:hypothetical protein [Tanacetum cinerariifolium]
MIDDALWEVIENGATLLKTKVMEGVTTVVPITTAKEKAQRRLERNKAYLDTMSIDDLYTNLKVYDPEVKWMSTSSLSIQNMAFVSTSNNNTSSTFGAVNTAREVSTASTQVNAAYSSNIDNLSDAVICLFFSSQPNSHQLVHEDLEQIHPYDIKKIDLIWQMAMLTMRARRKGLGYKNYNTVLPPYTRNLMPPTLDLSFTGLDEFVNKPVVENYKAKSKEEETKVVRKNDDALIVKEWVSDNEEEDVSQYKIEKKTVRPSITKIVFFKSKQQGKTARKTVKQVKQHSQNTHSPKGNQRNYNNMMSQKL